MHECQRGIATNARIKKSFVHWLQKNNHSCIRGHQKIHSCIRGYQNHSCIRDKKQPNFISFFTSPILYSYYNQCFRSATQIYI